MEPLVLAVLARAEAHGYDVAQSVGALTNGAVLADAGGVYRVLRRLEEGGFARSAWEDGGAGPARRAYRLTDDGRELLAHWRTHLADRMDVLRAVTAAVDSALDSERSHQ